MTTEQLAARARWRKKLYKLRKFYWTFTHPLMLVVWVGSYWIGEMFTDPTGPFDNADLLGAIVIVALFFMLNQKYGSK